MRIKVRDPKFDKRHLYGFIISEFYFVEGELIPTPKWVNYDAITIRTGPEQYDFRIIDRDNVVEVDGSYQPAKPSDQREVKITGKTGKIYTVTIKSGKAVCHCTGFTYRKTCSHIQEAIAA
jgi:hypothetical protein